MKNLRVLLIVCLFFLQTSCLQELSQFVSGGGNDGSTTTIDEEDAGSSDGSVNNATELGSEDVGSSGSDDVTSDSLESGGSESGTDAGETELDSEGFATLPVTPPKAINALTISVTNGSTTDAGIFNKMISPNAFAQEIEDDEEESTCRIIGKAETVDTDAELVLIDPTDGEVVSEFTAESDGSFDIGIASEYEGKGIGLTYADDDGDYTDQFVEVKIDTDCSDYTVGISRASIDIQDEMTVHDKTVFYNKTNDSGTNSIMMQSMTGDDAEIFAVTPTPLSQMYFFEPAVNDETGVKRRQMILGIDTYNNLIRVGPDGYFVLNDNVHAVAADATTSDTPEGFAFHAPQDTGRFSVVFSKDVATGTLDLSLVPTLDEATDISFNRSIRPSLKLRTMDWINSRLLMCVDQKRTSSTGTAVSSSNTTSLLVTFGLQRFTSLTEDELLALGDGETVSFDITPKRIMAADYALKNPITSPWKQYSETPFMIFEAKIKGAYKVGITDYTHAKIFANMPGYVIRKSLSRYGDVIAMQVFGGAERGSNILLIHLPTMTRKWLIDPDKFDKAMTLANPVFSKNYPYALTYQMEFSGEKRQIGVINLLYHPFFKTILEDAEPSYDIDHIIDSDDYLDMELTEIPVDHSDE